MKVSDFLRIVVLVTVMSVLYINLQVKIYSFAYRGKVKQQDIQQLAEINGRVRNDIIRLRSSDHIGRELLDKNGQYQFVSSQNIVEVSSNSTSSLARMMETGAQKTEGFFSRMALAFAAR